jgi:hypothetical protein
MPFTASIWPSKVWKLTLRSSIASTGSSVEGVVGEGNREILEI